MCTVVTQWQSGTEVRILAIRDELMSREFDDPAAWWPRLPGVFGGRDRTAGGTWCVSDIAAGATALVLNRAERRTGTPSRGVLPLAALEHGADWPAHIDHEQMASFTLVLAQASGVIGWTWTGLPGARLARTELAPGLHVFTSSGIDPDTPKGRRYTARFATRDWLDVVTSERPVDDRDALIIRHPVDANDVGAAGARGGDVYGTVFGQLLTSSPGTLHLRCSRTPWQADSWRDVALP